MSSNPRSVVIGAFASSSANASATLRICPAGYTLLLKSAYFQSRGTVGGIGAVSITRPGLGVPLDIADVTLTAGKAAAVMLELVMEPGDVLQAFLQDAQMAVWVSGSVLQGVGIIPPAAQQRPSIPGFMPLTSS